MEKCLTNISEKNCCGCRACEQRCPENAIQMVRNDNGFLIAEVNSDKCVECGICIKTCSFIEQAPKGEPIEIYAARYLNDGVVKKSSSGGVFPALAEYILDNNGVVVGCSYNQNVEAEHICIFDKKDIVLLQGSKYVQSDTKATYSEVKGHLLEGKKVLFSGTPCQVAGLKKYLHKEYENLYTVETICHGAPSPELFKEYLSWLGKKYNGTVTAFSFRDKEKKAWGGFDLRIQLDDGRVKFVYGQIDPYFVGFFEGRLSRESCYNCVYADKARAADLTLGDYWGIEKAHTDFVDPRGVSVVLVNSKKGEQLFDAVKNRMAVRKSKWEYASLLNPELKRPTVKPQMRDRFYEEFRQGDYDHFFSSTLKPGFRFKKRINNVIPFSLRTLIKKIK